MNSDGADSNPTPDDETSRGVIRYFRYSPDRFFATLGAIVFAAGWAGAIYLAFFSDYGPTGASGDAFRIQIMVGLGSSVTTASAVLWGVAAYLWVNLLPDARDA